MSPRETPEHSDAPKQLARFGYVQELAREMGGFSSFAMSFSIISVLTGCLTTYADAIGPGGPASLGIGWPLVTVGTLFVALAMAELASALPTAGALYHWSSLLGGPGWGWFTAMMNLVGQIAIVAAIDLGCARELGAALGASNTWDVPMFLAILTSHIFLNIYGVKLVARLNDYSAIVHIIGVVVIVGALFYLGRSQPFGFLFHSSATTRADGSLSFGFLNALLLSMYTFTGYDASAHLSEETKDPSREAPRGILSAVIVSGVAGYLLLCAMTLAIPDARAIATDEHPALTILTHAFGKMGGRSALGTATIAMWFCGLSSVTSASRTLWAFARDKGVPLSVYLSTVHSRLRTPIAALIGIALLATLFVFVGTRLSNRVFQTATQVATAGLYVSYGMPILLGVICRHRGNFQMRGAFHLGAFSLPIAWVAILWTAFVLVVCVLPPNGNTLIVLSLWTLALGASWILYVKKRFRGPRVTLALLNSSA